jgi:hypothetical protein
MFIALIFNELRPDQQVSRQGSFVIVTGRFGAHNAGAPTRAIFAR